MDDVSPCHNRPLATALLKDPTPTLLSALSAGTQLTPRVGSRRGLASPRGRPGILVAWLLLAGGGGVL